MNFVFRTIRLPLVLVLLVSAVTGCHPTQPFYVGGSGNLDHYVDVATRVEHPDVDAPILEDVGNSTAPLTLSNPEFKEMWDLSLQQVVAISLNNAKVIRGGVAARLQNGQLFPGAGEGTLVQSPTQFETIYNPALIESHPGFNFNNLFPDGGINQARQGVEAALADFDAQLHIAGGNNANQAGAFVSNNNRPQNVNPSTFTGFPTVLNLKSGAVTYELVKKNIEGGTVAVRGSTDYDSGNQRGTFQALNSIWTQTVETEIRHPLLQGRGAQINRIPIMIARISNDVELLNLQNQLNEMLCNIEIRYWDLHNAYRTLETARVGRDASLLTWRIVYDKYKQGAESVQPEAQSREQYFAFRAQVEIAYRELLNAEGELRLLMGIGPTDGRLIRPIDEPTLARVEFEWNDALTEAITRRPELISKRWQLKQREMEIILARNKLLPQLDVGALYRWIGIGDHLVADHRGPTFPATGSNAFSDLTQGNYQEFALFGQFSMPVGFRRELAAVRHFELRMAREKALLEDMELDVTHGLTKSIRNLDSNFQLSQTNANRWAAAAREVEALQALYAAGKASLDLVLEAQRRRATAQNAFWTSVAEYNKSIADVHCRKGSILDYNGIAFEEGPWPTKAYYDAVGLARERDASLRVDYGWTRPKVISRGPAQAGALLGAVINQAVVQTPQGEVGGGLPTEEIETPEGMQPSDTLPSPMLAPEMSAPDMPATPDILPPGNTPPADNSIPQSEARRTNSILKSTDNFRPTDNLKSADNSNPFRGGSIAGGLRGAGSGRGIATVQYQEPLRDNQRQNAESSQADRQAPGLTAGGAQP